MAIKIVGVLLVLGALAAIVLAMQAPAPVPGSVLPTAVVTIGKAIVQVEIASTPAQRAQGLSGRATICGAPLRQGCGEAQKGMLFVFQKPTQDGFWMKDMHFALDIIWVDSGGEVVTIAPNLSPETYPKSFYPRAPALMVLEVPAGFAAAYGIAIGDKVVVK